jgi:hypothetical protein
MKRYLHLIIYMAILVLLGSCSKQPKKFVIGVSQCSEDIWRDKLNDELKTSWKSRSCWLQTIAFWLLTRIF